LRVAEAHSVDIVFVAGDPKDRLTALNVVNVDAIITSPGYDFSTIARKPNRPDAEVGVEATRRVTA
jgi:hypothetical protein